MRYVDPYETAQRNRRNNSISEEQLRDVTGASALPMPKFYELPGRHVMLDNLTATITLTELEYLTAQSTARGVKLSSRFGRKDNGYQY